MTKSNVFEYEKDVEKSHPWAPQVVFQHPAGAKKFKKR